MFVNKNIICIYLTVLLLVLFLGSLFLQHTTCICSSLAGAKNHDNKNSVYILHHQHSMFPTLDSSAVSLL